MLTSSADSRRSITAFFTSPFTSLARIQMAKSQALSFLTICENKILELLRVHAEVNFEEQSYIYFAPKQFLAC